jgi:hypothetical protein
VHEYRPQAEATFEQMGWPVRNGELRYYGSADGTPWFSWSWLHSETAPWRMS